ncbi:hypothetical protein, partial [Enterococcus gallinarum]|uniref:hypothetical protein n=1 Tax=Enterococcus gallinarum TaxID=1353 RepID=UPI00132F6289
SDPPRGRAGAEGLTSPSLYHKYAVLSCRMAEGAVFFMKMTARKSQRPERRIPGDGQYPL